MEKGITSKYPELTQKYKTISNRCRNPHRKDYYLYGGRGIKLLFAGAVPFIQYLLEIGYIPNSGLELDRIDNNGHLAAITYPKYKRFNTI